jgi:hypothetical protein
MNIARNIADHLDDSNSTLKMILILITPLLLISSISIANLYSMLLIRALDIRLVNSFKILMLYILETFFENTRSICI